MHHYIYVAKPMCQVCVGTNPLLYHDAVTTAVLIVSTGASKLNVDIMELDCHELELASCGLSSGPITRFRKLKKSQETTTATSFCPGVNNK